MRGWCVFIVGIIVVCLFPVHGSALSPYTSGSLGTDVSWPNCQEEAALPKQVSFGIVGVNDGLDFKGNPCLIQEAGWFSNYSLYLSTGYPGQSYGLKYRFEPKHCTKSNADCLAFNYGYAAARYALAYASLRNAHTTHWWLDVESDNSWTEDNSANVASLRGMLAALQHYTFLPTIGFYAYPLQWDLLTGSWQNGMAIWADSGSSEKSSAVAACREQSFTGGPLVLAQFTLTLDNDYACPLSSVVN